MKVASAFLVFTLLAGCFVVAAAARGLDRGSRKPVAVCTLPTHAVLATLDNPARGITFQDCPRQLPPPPLGSKLALVSVAVHFGLEAQFFDTGKFDDYWLKAYLDPKLAGFKTDCWEAPALGCAKPAPAAAAPPGAAGEKVVLFAGEQRGKYKPYSGPSDAELLPLDDPSLH
ncbi:uncharacterized protein SRS1_12087 [Sporisorium reilianum f. sp. reilianum]|uniref:Mig1 protein n=1 Tax=Sporisorium reilianum f. sp. reilianum TaxID=72559 RepID=A0A2N8U835_9BASI|nr:uncharacterized protein SRS1_12087 [Sporisorium reilianum f. sp. reilianum]